jgi:hypothetical protein
MINIEEYDLRALRSEMLHERSANPRCSSRDEDQLISQAWIGGKAFWSTHGEKVYNTSMATE